MTLVVSMRLVLSVSLLTVSLGALPSRLAAWNEVGHAVVAVIAYDELGKENPKLQLQLLEMLKKHPHYEQFLASNRPADANVAQWALIRASNWADWVRPPFKDGVKADPRIVRFHRAFDHFINYPVIVTTGANALVGQAPPPDPDTPDIHSAFRQRMGELNERMVAGEDKAVALCWVAHLVGDIHQPLHAGTMVSRQFPTGDLGGNRFGVKIAGKLVRLHTYWDNLLGEVPGWYDDNPEHQEKMFTLVTKVSESLREPKYSRAALADLLLKDLTFGSWIEESHELAKSVAYRDGDKYLEGVVVPSRGGVPDDAPQAGAEYDQRAREVARQRVALAGYRLADKLKRILARQSAN
jgi:hypothetical protein